MKKPLWPTNWFWYKTIQRNKEVNNKSGWRFTTGCLIDYDYIKNHFRQFAVDLSRQKELRTDPKAIQEIDLVGQLKNTDDVNADGTESMFVLTILEKIKETRLNFSQGRVTVL